MADHVEKLVLLFVFDKMEVPLSENTILDLCCYSNNWINYMDCQGFMQQLLEAGFIYVINPKAAEPQYTITPAGRTCLAHFYTNIQLSLRERIASYIKTNCMVVKRRQDYTSEYEPNMNGGYTVTLKVLAPGETSMEIKLDVPSREKAESLHQRWEEKAAKTYEALYEILLSE